LLLVLIAREPVRPGQRVHDVVATVVLGLTGPFIIALLPLFAWRAIQRRTVFSTSLAVLAAGAAGIQAVLIMRGGMTAPDAPIAFETMLGIPGVRVGGSLLSGGRWGAGLGVPCATALGVLTLATVMIFATRPGPGSVERRMMGVAFVGLLAIALYRCRYVLPALFHGAGCRYFFPLQTIALWLMVATALTARRPVSFLAWSAVAGIFALNVPRLREPAFADLNWPEYAARIRNGERVIVRINPGWEFTMPGKDQSRQEVAARGIVGDALVNISTRCVVTPTKPAIAGFALRAASARKFLVRAVGPSLARFGIDDVLARPRIALFRDGVEDTTFDPMRNGSGDVGLAQVTESCRAFALEPEAADLAGVAVLHPGVYSLIVSTDGSIGGEVLVEIYEVPQETGASRTK
jgi:hypothetical protein